MVPELHIYDSVTSTNDVVEVGILRGVPEGYAVRATTQSAGYGRQGRSWESPAGGLYLSFALYPQVDPQVLPTLSLVVGLAVQEVVASLVLEEWENSILVKWPNDLVVKTAEHPGDASISDFAKLCGISCETAGKGVCVGIGLNVFRPAGSVSVEGGLPITYLEDFTEVTDHDLPHEDVLNALASRILLHFGNLYDQWQQQGFAPFVDRYNAHSALQGLDIEVVNQKGEPLGAGKAEGVDAEGQLLLDTAEGKRFMNSGEAHILSNPS